MQIFLMQHGVAVPGAEDPARPLTEAGALEVRRVVERARAAGVRVDRCVHSGKLRAAQTAGILTSGLGAAEPEDRAGLGPSDPVGPVARWLVEAARDGSIAVVGHLPSLDRLASLLVAGDESAGVVRFRNGGLVALVPKDVALVPGDGAGGFCVAWVLVPEVA